MSFADAIAKRLLIVDPVCGASECKANAEAILDIKQMVSVKIVLLHFANVCTWTRGDDQTDENRRRHLRLHGLDEEVVMWVVPESMETRVDE